MFAVTGIKGLFVVKWAFTTELSGWELVHALDRAGYRVSFRGPDGYLFANEYVQ